MTKKIDLGGTPSKQSIFAGRLQDKFQQELQNVLMGRFGERLWSGTLFILANKEHYGLKDHCLFLYFRDKMETSQGARASLHFVSSAETKSYLANASREYAFCDFVHDPPAIPAVYCALRQFGSALIAMQAPEPQNEFRKWSTGCVAPAK